MPSVTRKYLRVPAFDEMQNPRRPNRPTWIKSFVRDLDDPDRLMLSLTVRGFLCEFEKLAATMMNRVPYDIPFIARKINAPPRVVGKALHACITHQFITEFDEDAKTKKSNDIYQKTDSRPIPPSLSPSNSRSTGTTVVESTTVPIDHESEARERARVENSFPKPVRHVTADEVFRQRHELQSAGRQSQ